MDFGPLKLIHSEPSFDCFSQEITLDTGNVMTMVHLDVYRWSRGVLRDLQEAWAQIRQTLPTIVFTQGRTSDAKFSKFLKHFGWQLIGPCVCTDGVDRPLHAHFRYENNGNRQFSHH